MHALKNIREFLRPADDRRGAKPRFKSSTNDWRFLGVYAENHATTYRIQSPLYLPISAVSTWNLLEGAVWKDARAGTCS